MGMDLLYLTTIGAKTGQKRLTPVARFPDGDGSWLVVASSAGSAHNPSWYHNIAAHPDQVWIEVAGQQLRVTAEQLEGQRREQAWQRIVAGQPRYAGYQRKTDRVLPIIRLSPAQTWTVRKYGFACATCSYSLYQPVQHLPASHPDRGQIKDLSLIG
jgi:deazaflavin-dependent oxidoreductase (nitroreductase family)